MYCNDQRNSFILQCARDGWRMVWAAITFVTRMGRLNVVMTVQHISGRFIELNLIPILTYRLDQEGQSESAESARAPKDDARPVHRERAQPASRPSFAAVNSGGRDCRREVGHERAGRATRE